MSNDDKIKTIIWMRPSGSEIETNDLPATVEYAKSLGWERVDSEKSLDKMTVPELKDYAEANEIDLGDATKKPDILAAIEAA